MTSKSKPKITNTTSQTVNNANLLAAIHTKLKAADPEIQNYITALEKENLKLQRQIAKLQADNVSLNNRIKALIEQNEKDKETALFDIFSRISEKMKNYGKNV